MTTTAISTNMVFSFLVSGRQRVPRVCSELLVHALGGASRLPAAAGAAVVLVPHLVLVVVRVGAAVLDGQRVAAVSAEVLLHAEEVRLVPLLGAGRRDGRARVVR